MSETMTALPDKLSELIRVAQSDLRACEKDPLYEINMDEWHTFKEGACAVCLAGSVLAQTLHVPAFISVNVRHLPSTLQNKIDALDDVRTGCIGDALRSFGGFDWPQQDAPVYQRSPEAFHAYLTRIADELEAAGL